MNPHTIAPLVAGQAVSSVALGLAISVLAWIALRVATRLSSTARFAVLYSALVAIVALFFLRQPVAGSDAPHPAPFTLSPEWAFYLIIAWFVLAFAGIARIAVGLWRLRGLRRSFVSLNTSSLGPVLEERVRLSKRTVGLFHSPRVRVPAAIGFFRPAVVLPSWSLHELSADELKSAVLHELAHVDRWDDWTNLAQKLIRALLFFHPAVWWLDSMLALERELSCDDAVLAQTGSPDQYAQCLVSLAERSLLKRPLSLAQAAIGRIKQTALRLSRILDRQERKVSSAWKPALTALAAFSVLGLVGVRYIPQLVVFQAARSSEAMVASNHSSLAVVPAEMHGSASSVNNRSSAPAVHATKRSRTPLNRSGDLLARKLGRPSAVVTAAAKEPVTAQFMYVVMETRDYDAFGRVRVTTSVWRLRFTTSAPVGTENTAPPHST